VILSPAAFTAKAFSTITQVFQHASSLNPFRDGVFAPPFPKSALFLRRSLTKQPYQHPLSPTRAGEGSCMLTTAFSEPRCGSRHRVVLTAVFLPDTIVVTSGCDCLRSRNLWPFG